MSPLDKKQRRSNKTISIHRESGTWRSAEEQIELDNLLKRI